MTEPAPNMWSFLSLLITVVLGPVVMFFLNRRQTRTLQADLEVGNQKLDKVHETTTKTEVLVNGDRLAMQLRIKELETRLRTLGVVDP